jgi:hypothetical protein
MTQLKRLNQSGHVHISEEFLRGDEDLTVDDLSPYIEPVNATGDLDELQEVLIVVMDSYDKYDPMIDSAAGPNVHQLIDITRRQAGDPGIWHYLTVVEFPEFVRYRWGPPEKRNMRNKFLKAGTDIYSNALHRLWWISELTYGIGGDGERVYSLTEDVLANQTLANKIFDRWFARHKPAAVACAEVLLEAEADSTVIEQTTLRFRETLSKVQLEGMSEDAIGNLIETILLEVEAELS